MDDVGSSPGSLSSPPHSPEQGNGNGNNSTIRVLSNSGGVAGNTSSPTPASTTPAPRLTAAGTIRKKPGPKPKPKDPNAPEKKPRKPRKTAEPKDPAEPTTRKRRTKASLEAQAAPAPTPPPVKEEPLPPPPPQQQQQQQQLASTPQTRASEPIAVQQQQLEQPAQSVQSVQPVQPVAAQARVLSNPEPLHNNPNLSHINPAPSTPRPASSGQRYDPIRGGLYESKPQGSASAPPPPVSPPFNRASASPSITSLIDPPSASHSHYAQSSRLQQQASITSAPVSPATAPRPAPLLPHNSSPQQQTQQQHQLPLQHQSPQPGHIRPPGAGEPTPMDIDSESASKQAPGGAPKKADSAGAGTPSNSNAPTPPVKPARQKEAPPPLPTGSGLLSGTPFGPVNNGSTGSTDAQGVNIWLTIPLRGQQNVTINFAQEVEKKYGFAALHPKIAARKERLRQVTAAGAALEKAAGNGSNDEMSLDLSEPESNVEMGGMDDEGSAAGTGVKRRRKRKQEDYDKEDDFIDDTELAWEQSALMAKDGFFVYSGPLVTEGDKPAVERADGTVRRGRGRGRGGTVRGETSGRGRGRGGGPGSRGGNISRKPRVTKAERALMEQEKLEREKMGAAIAAKQPLGYAGTSAL